MQIDSISQYLSQVMHTNDTASVSSKTTASDSTSSVDQESFDDYYNTYIDTKEDNTTTATSYKDLIGLMGGTTSSSSSTTVSDDDRTPLQVAQDAYSEFLSWAADAVGGSSGSDESSSSSSEDSNSSESIANAIAGAVSSTTK